MGINKVFVVTAAKRDCVLRAEGRVLTVMGESKREGRRCQRM
jgi:hypothetical protein